MFISAGFNIEGSSLILEWVGYSIFNSDNVNFVLKTNRWGIGVGKVSFVVCVLWGTLTLADGAEILFTASWWGLKLRKLVTEDWVHVEPCKWRYFDLEILK